MAAYSLSPRIPLLNASFKIEPGAYQNGTICHFRKNKVPFNSSTKRVTAPCNKKNVDVLYNADIPPRIFTPTVFKSKVPRFPYEAFSKDDLEQLLCYCGLQLACDCEDKGPAANQNEQPQALLNTCQGKRKKILYIGLHNKGHFKKNLNSNKPCPPFYDATVKESTQYYHGCKWSQRTSQRAQKSLNMQPGPADYNIVKEPTTDEICSELVRHYRRKYSKQPRFIEMLQNKIIRDNQPSPATYEVNYNLETGLRFLKADRFPKENAGAYPGPAQHWIKRFADRSPPPERISHVTLPNRSSFGTRAARFKHRREEGPSPATYDSKLETCGITHCSTIPFGSSAKRFPDPPIDEDTDNDEEESKPEIEDNMEPQCPEWKWTWCFRSRTKRFTSLFKKINEPSPADYLPPLRFPKRSQKLQYLAPFTSSEGRFMPWYDWVPVVGTVRTPGPANYCLEKMRCPSAVSQGPLIRTRRFNDAVNLNNPAPNTYEIEKKSDILATFNQRLKKNIENKHQHKWDPPVPRKTYTLLQLEANLLNKTIALLDDIADPPAVDVNVNVDTKRCKLLKCFV